MTKTNTAAIDLGTNSCRLLITDEKGNIVCRNAVSTRMGEKMSENKRFTDEAIKRGIECFCNFKQLMDQNDVKQYRAVATAACRVAENGAEFVEKIKQHANIDLEIISGAEEARLNLLGAIKNMTDPKKEYVVLYDLGGGSTEITLANRNAEIIYTISIPWGARNSAEIFSINDYDEEKADCLRREITSYCREFRKAVHLSQYKGKVCFMATSSTPLRLAHIVKGWEKYERERADGIKIAVSDFNRVIGDIFSSTEDKRRQNPYIGETRADIFVAACVIFSQIYTILGAKELIVSLKGAVEGITEELQNGTYQNS
ncbi:MAG: hypothetical protein IJ689_04685 [Alphaproteobacteria bacterium]|nr:hypothetical protein [Alphaproteobacteria bacterium]